MEITRREFIKKLMLGLVFIMTGMFTFLRFITLKTVLIAEKAVHYPGRIKKWNEKEFLKHSKWSG